MNKLIILFCMIMPYTAGAYENKFYKQHKAVIEAIFWAADEMKVPRLPLLAICWNESSLIVRKSNHHKDGKSFSYGICQIKLGTAMYMDEIYAHKTPVSVKTLKTSKINALYAAKYFRYQLHRYDFDIYMAVDAYNKHNAISENTKYVKKFKKNLKWINEKLNGDQDPGLCDSGVCFVSIDEQPATHLARRELR